LGKKKAINLMIDEIVADKDNILNNEIHVGCTVGNEEERNLLSLLASLGLFLYFALSVFCQNYFVKISRINLVIKYIRTVGKVKKTYIEP